MLPFSSSQLAKSKGEPHPPHKGKPKFQRQSLTNSSSNLQKSKQQGLSATNNRGEVTSRPSSVYLLRPGSSSGSCTKESSLEGIGLEDDLAKALPELSKQDSFNKYDPLPPIQFRPLSSESDSSDCSLSQTQSLPSTAMGGYSQDKSPKVNKTTKSTLKMGRHFEQETSPISAKRARPLYRKGAIFKNSSSNEVENSETKAKHQPALNERQKKSTVPRNKRKGQPLLLAFRLLDGERIEHSFSTCDTIGEVMAYLLERSTSVNNKNVKDFILCSHQVPLKEYRDLRQTLEEANITDRMLLYLTDK